LPGDLFQGLIFLANAIELRNAGVRFLDRQGLAAALE
jgi:hypothetical protein